MNTSKVGKGRLLPLLSEVRRLDVANSDESSDAEKSSDAEERFDSWESFNFEENLAREACELDLARRYAEKRQWDEDQERLARGEYVDLDQSEEFEELF